MILDSLKQNNRLITFNLAGNDISEPILQDIENCLIANSKLAGPASLHQTGMQTYASNAPTEPRSLGEAALRQAQKTIQAQRIEGLASAEAVLNEERRRDLESKDFLSRQLDDLRRKDLRGA